MSGSLALDARVSTYSERSWSMSRGRLWNGKLLKELYEDLEIAILESIVQRWDSSHHPTAEFTIAGTATDLVVLQNSRRRYDMHLTCRMRRLVSL